ncbi:MAG: phosphoribosylformylglycinamidine synthase subunit PurS [Ferroplasma sp.]|uniref:phosphoribosylformylglycinamidine synthase subunit PurS n=1 Tax=Ferroplasma sp. TaxID=2591003 RepID=UPI002815ACAF|nr:phosphoribosylformylglycinamidine synthase subunit PurS [Ferroplasma sp.]WMT51106.1 MAG: phosphoribosylformylglycinamidine synthase subunit PurS [Ferroplasma sp.]
MRIKVQIRYLPNVEDPEALSIKRNLELTGYRGIKNVYSYKTYEFETTLDKKDSMDEIREITEKLLTNPVIQEYKIEEISE